MTTEQALRAAIAAAPDDFMRYGVLGDQLAETGQQMLAEGYWAMAHMRVRPASPDEVAGEGWAAGADFLFDAWCLNSRCYADTPKTHRAKPYWLTDAWWTAAYDMWLEADDVTSADAVAAAWSHLTNDQRAEAVRLLSPEGPSCPS